MITKKELENNVDFINDLLEKSGKGQMFLYKYKNGKYQISIYKNENGVNDYDGVDHDWMEFTTKKQVKTFLQGFYKSYKFFSN